MAALNLLVHTVLMFALPIGSFFYVRSGALDTLLLHFSSPTPQSRNVAAGVVAVVVVQFVIVSFLIAAWQEAPPAKVSGKQD